MKEVSFSMGVGPLRWKGTKAEDNFSSDDTSTWMDGPSFGTNLRMSVTYCEAQ